MTFATQVNKAAATLSDRAYIAREILQELQVLTTKLPVPVEQFKDDDFYVYLPLTRELVTYCGSRSRYVRAPLVCANGLTCKSLKLWRAA